MSGKDLDGGRGEWGVVRVKGVRVQRVVKREGEVVVGQHHPTHSVALMAVSHHKEKKKKEEEEEEEEEEE